MSARLRREAVALEVEGAALRVAEALERGASLAAATQEAAEALGDSPVGMAFEAISRDLASGAHPWRAFGAQAGVLGLSVVEPLMGAGGGSTAFRDAARAAGTIARLRRQRGLLDERSRRIDPAEDEALEVCVMLAYALEAAMPLGSALHAAGAPIGGGRCDWAGTAAEYSLAHGDLAGAFGSDVPAWFRDVLLGHVGSESLVDELQRAVVHRAQAREGD